MIFPTCVANTKALGDDADKLTGLVICFIGVGEIIGSFSSGALSKIGNWLESKSAGVKILENEISR